jgi:putative oxidoreductase
MSSQLSSDRAKHWALIIARVALACSYLSGIADRFGLWPARYEGYGDFDGFIAYTAKVNSFMPASTIVYLAWAATAAELTLGVAFLVGYKLRWVSLASAALLLVFGTAMALSFGLKSPLDYSVFSAMGASLLLAAFAPHA